MTVCEKPSGFTELTDEEFEGKKAIAKAKKHHGVIDGKEPDMTAF